MVERETEPEIVELFRGEVMETAGEVVSVVDGMGKEQEAVVPPLLPRQDQR